MQKNNIKAHSGGTTVNDFIEELQDLRYLDWADKKLSVGTPGCFLKAYEESDERKIY